jgi:hypothetical protein
MQRGLMPSEFFIADTRVGITANRLATTAAVEAATAIRPGFRNTQN